MGLEKKEIGESRRANGRHYEDVASKYYESLGFEILERNWQAGHKEIDLIVRNETSLAFVEVKGGTIEYMGHPSYRIDQRKQKFLIEAAQKYLIEHDTEGLDLSFEALVVVRTRAGEKIERYTNAFAVE